MEVDEDVEASGGRRQSKQGKPKPVRLNHGLNIESLDGADELQCHFNQNSYRMVYVINRDNYLYRERALPKARQVNHLTNWLFVRKS